MSFSIAGIKIYISVLFTAVIALMLYFDRTGLMVLSLLAVILHELGHIIAMRLLKKAPSRIDMMPYGMTITAPPVAAVSDDMIISSAGPIINIVVGSAALITYNIYPISIIGAFAIINFLLALLNLLPTYGLDGGTVFYSMIYIFFGEPAARIVLKISSLVVLFIVIIVGVFVMFSSLSNPTLLLLGIYLLVLRIMKL